MDKKDFLVSLEVASVLTFLFLFLIIFYMKIATKYYSPNSILWTILFLSELIISILIVYGIIYLYEEKICKWKKGRLR